MNTNKTILAIVAHPDDAEFTCTGTLALLADKGWKIVIATMTPGDGGSIQYNREEISDIRTKESVEAAKIIGASYHCLWMEDIFIMYDKPTLISTIELVRKIRPAVVLTMSPSCYMVDHETTSRLVQTACFAAGVVNIKTGNIEPYEHIPYLYYTDAMEGKDRMGADVVPGMLVDISSKIEVREQMLACHKSQHEWLMAHHGMNEYTASMKKFSAKRGKEISTAYAEGFRQHLGHAYPQDNILQQELGSLVYLLK